MKYTLTLAEAETGIVLGIWDATQESHSVDFILIADEVYDRIVANDAKEEGK